MRPTGINFICIPKVYLLDWTKLLKHVPARKITAKFFFYLFPDFFGRHGGKVCILQNILNKKHNFNTLSLLKLTVLSKSTVRVVIDFIATVTQAFEYEEFTRLSLNDLSKPSML